MTVTSIKRPVGVKLLVMLELLKTPIIFIILPSEVEWPWMGAFLMAFALGGYNLGLGWGLWNMKKWAYKLTLFLSILSIAIFGLFIVGFYFVILFSNSIWWLIAPIIILYYLTQSKIKAIFGVKGFRL